MRVHCVEAKQLAVAPLLTEGPMANYRYKFTLIGDEFVYGNVCHHWDLVGWLLRGPLAGEYPREIVRARPIIESKKILTVFGELCYGGEIKMVVHIAPSDTTLEDIERLITDVFRVFTATQEVA